MQSEAATAGAARPRLWSRPAVLVVGALVLIVAGVLAARGLRTLPAVEAFLTQYPGDAPRPADAPVGFPAWVAIQHSLNALFLLFTVRSGWRLHRAERPTLFWTRRNDGRIRTKNPPIRIALDLWTHYVADTLWALNGALYLLLVLVTGHWLRLVPLDWGVVPAAVSTGLQYASLDWPTTNAWVNYNGLQQLAYFAVVFVASPLALLTGLRSAPGFAARLRFLDRVLPLRWSTRIHWWTMLALVAFTVGHVALVLATGAVRNLNHIYALRDDDSPAGVIVILGFLALTALVWFVVTRPGLVRWAAARTGTVLERPAHKPR